MPDITLDNSNRILSIPAPLASAPTSRHEQTPFEDILQNRARIPTPLSNESSAPKSSEENSLNQPSEASSETSKNRASCAPEQSPEQTDQNATIENQTASPSDQKKTTETTKEETPEEEQSNSEDIVVAIIEPQLNATNAVVENADIVTESTETNEEVVNTDEEIDQRFKRSTTPTMKLHNDAKSAHVGLTTRLASVHKTATSNAPTQEPTQEIEPVVDTDREQAESIAELAKQKLTETKSNSESTEIVGKKLKSAKNNSTKDEKQTDAESNAANEENADKKPIIAADEQSESEPIEPQEQKPTRAANRSSQSEATDSKAAVATDIVAAVEARTTSSATSAVEKSTDKARDTADSNITRATQDTTPQKPTTQNENRTPIVPPALLQRRDEAQSAQQSRNDGSLSEIERVRLVQRVAKAFHTLGNNEGEMKLRLSPPELGAVKLEVSYREGVLHARMETESTSTRNILMENLPQLKERLAEQNVRIETFDVNVRDQNSGNNSQQQYDFAREQMERARARAQNLPNPSAQIARAATSTITRNISLNQNSTQLNVII